LGGARPHTARGSPAPRSGGGSRRLRRETEGAAAEGGG
jgi:hypothetical protein